ncbi:MAG: hypothetical protein LBE22_01660 [Azoarcus sp.]|jgi:hypothetical protein|nr:hypothetical protein [Azoarcus sp.]
MNKKLKKIVRPFLIALILWLFVGFEYNPPGYEQDVGLWLPFIKRSPSFQIKFQSQLHMRTRIFDSISLSDSDKNKFSRYCSIRFGKDLVACYNILEDTFIESVNAMRDEGDRYSPVYYEEKIRKQKEAAP